MKKLIFLFLFLSIIFASCVSKPFTVWYDKNLDREMSSELMITGGIEINSFNNQSCFAWGDKDKYINVLTIIPPGTHLIEYTIRPHYIQGISVNASDYVYTSTIEYSFKAGNKYALTHLTRQMASSMNIQWQEGMVHIINTTYLESKYF